MSGYNSAVDRHMAAVSMANNATFAKFKVHGPYKVGSEYHNYWLSRYVYYMSQGSW